MFIKILSGYAKTARSLAAVLLLFLFCALTGLCIVYPLWKCAVMLPEVYTVFVCAIFIAAVVSAVFLRIRKYVVSCGTDKAERTRRIRSLSTGAVKILLVVCGIVVSFLVLYNGSRLGFLIIVLATVLLYGILGFVSRKN